MTRQYLKCKRIENGKLISALLIIVWILMAFLLKGYETAGVALLVAGIIWTSFEIALFHKISGIDEVLSGCGFYQQKKQYLVIKGTLICTAPFALVLLLFLCLFYKGVLWISLMYSLVVYIFANGLGIVLVRIPNLVLAHSVCLLVSIVNFPKLLFLEQNFRHISAVVPVGNLEMFQWWNVCTLLVIGGSFYLWVIWKRRSILYMVMFLVGAIFVTDFIVSKKDTAVSKDYELRIVDAVEKVNSYYQRFGLECLDTVEVQKSVYYPWMSSEAKIPVCVEKQKLFVNCFTPSLCNMSEEEIINRIIRSHLKPEYGAQNIMFSMYMSWVLGERERVEAYVTSRNEFDALVSDVIVNHSEEFGELYSLAKQMDAKEEIIESWKKKNL